MALLTWQSIFWCAVSPASTTSLWWVANWPLTTDKASKCTWWAQCNTFTTLSDRHLKVASCVFQESAVLLVLITHIKECFGDWCLRTVPLSLYLSIGLLCFHSTLPYFSSWSRYAKIDLRRKNSSVAECKQFSKCFSYRQIWSHFELCSKGRLCTIVCLNLNLPMWVSDHGNSHLCPIALPCICQILAELSIAADTHTCPCHCKSFIVCSPFQSIGKSLTLCASIAAFCQLLSISKYKVAHWPRVSHRSRVLLARQIFYTFSPPYTWRLLFPCVSLNIQALANWLIVALNLTVFLLFTYRFNRNARMKRYQLQI